MLTAKEARKLTNLFNSKEKIEEYVEHLSFYIKQEASMGESCLLFIMPNEYKDIEQLIIDEFKDLGYKIKPSNLYCYNNPLYKLEW